MILRLQCIFILCIKQCLLVASGVLVQMHALMLEILYLHDLDHAQFHSLCKINSID